MKYSTVIFLVVYISSCNDIVDYNIKKYFSQINKAELLICEGDHSQALETYKSAFKEIQKPFGKDLFNAALCGQLSGKLLYRNEYLQIIINNSDELEFLRSNFLGTYLTVEEWQQLIATQHIDYDPALRKEFEEIHRKDQLFRPMYDTHDDTINANRKENLARILELTDLSGFPSHIELGFTNYLRGQKHDIVLHHTAQRRSKDKSVLDLEPILHKAVTEGRIDPETAIFYMNFQNDLEKGKFEVYSVWQYMHHLLPDSLNNKIWIPKLNEEQVNQANSKRKEWYANSLEDIGTKAYYLSRSNLPFIFTSVKKSTGSLRDDFDRETAFKQYKIGTSFMKEYNN